MKLSGTLKTAANVAIFVLMGYTAMAQRDSLKKVKMAEKWVKAGEWKKGMKMNVFADVNSVEFERQYKANKELWDKVFAYVADTHNLETVAPGKYPIDGDNAFAIITDGPTKDPAVVKWEAHHKYIDLHYVIRGAEKISMVPIASATLTVPYDATKDAANYTGEGKTYTATPDEFYLFFPSDVHRPGMKANGVDTDKKLVVKIIYAP